MMYYLFWDIVVVLFAFALGIFVGRCIEDKKP